MAEDAFEKCFIMLCNKRTEKECIGRGLFGDKKYRLEYMKEIRPGDIGFLLNITTNELIGKFKALSEAQIDIVKEAWGGGFRAQVRVEPIGELKRISEAATLLAKHGISLIDLKSGALVPLIPVQSASIGRKLLECLGTK
ncbi:MAG: hypothetical protein ACFFBD_19155 [Candidatus Hodarchaeota archaeon]